MQYLLSLNLSKNQIQTLQIFNPEADEEILPNLQYLNLSGNKITSLEHLKLNRLRKLILNENEISSCENFEGHPTLQILELKTNKLKEVTGIKNCPNLTELYLDENELRNFKQLVDLPKLKLLSLNKNQIKKIKCPLPYLPSLYTLSLGENAFTRFTDLLSIQKIKTVYELNVAGNSLDVEDAKIEILIFLPYMTKVNEEEITKQDRDDAQKQLNERIEEAKRQ